MAGGGPLKIHPLNKTYDEAKRGEDRLRQYLNTYRHEISEEQHKACARIIVSLRAVQKDVPEEYRKTVWQLRKEKGE